MPSVLEEILEHKREELAERKKSMSLSALEKAAVPGNYEFLSGFRKSRINIIAEIKPRSPSMGTLRKDVNLHEIVEIYSKFACAISVLTDARYFGGNMEILAEVSKSTQLPTLCKDFIIDEWQCYEARIAGAAAVLLIVKALDDEALEQLHNKIETLGMVPLVEVQNESELARALHVSPDVILVNNRNLDTLEVDLATSERLIPQIPEGIIAISASGITTREDINRLSPICGSFLIGSSLMQSDDIEAKLKGLVSEAPARTVL